MATYRITRRSSGQEMGEYEGTCEYAALEAMMADAGNGAAQEAPAAGHARPAPPAAMMRGAAGDAARRGYR